jgi:hypothetical protein
LTKLKFTQETYNPSTDNYELMLADYYSNNIIPECSDTEHKSNPTAVIAYSGNSPTIKVGGSYKVFTPVFDNESVTVDKWTISDDKGDISSDTTNYTIEYDGDKLKLKVAQNYYLIDTVLIIKVVGTDKSTAEVKVQVIG